MKKVKYGDNVAKDNAKLAPKVDVPLDNKSGTKRSFTEPKGFFRGARVRPRQTKSE